MPPRIQPFTVQEKTAQGHSPWLSRFLSGEPLPAKHFVHGPKATPAEATANSIRETRRRFNEEVPEGDEERKYAALDRQNVLDVYGQALDKLGEIPNKHIQIAAECTRKVRVILGVITADPADPVFTRSGQLLRPLEPQYANPRLEARDDPECYRAQWRLNHWRKEGWPDKHPAEAIRREEKEKGEKLVGRGSMSAKMIRQRSQEEDGIVKSSPHEDERRITMQAATKVKEKKTFANVSARKGIVSDTKEWENVESNDNEDRDD
jgi:hypothetical protein